MKFVISVLLIGAIYCEDVLVQDGHLEDNSRAIREFNPEVRFLSSFIVYNMSFIFLVLIVNICKIMGKIREFLLKSLNCFGIPLKVTEFF